MRFTPVDAGGVPAEWVLAPGADPRRRTLYIHGGAFVMGSPRSHRTLTSRFSKMTGGAVLAIDYRLMPENIRAAPASTIAAAPTCGCWRTGRTGRRRRRPCSWPAIRPAAT